MDGRHQRMHAGEIAVAFDDLGEIADQFARLGERRFATEQPERRMSLVRANTPFVSSVSTSPWAMMRMVVCPSITLTSSTRLPK